MEKDVIQLMDMLYDLVNNAKNLPLSGEKCILDRDEALDLLDEMREQLPLEVKKAKELMNAREEYIQSAKRDVEKMLRQAELDAKVIVSESETIQLARQKSNEIGPPRRGAHPRAVPCGQHLHRGCPAPHGGGHPDGSHRGTGVPRPLPRRQPRADAGPAGAAERRAGRRGRP